MKSVSRKCRCPKCGKITNQYHGTYTRRVQDLPILGKNVRLEIKVHEYNCTNEGCDISTVTESFDGFLNTYSRLIERCADFICTLALETSFLAAALTMLRSSYYALGYAANDLVLIVLWILASFENPDYMPVVINFAIFLFNDIYGFLCWKKRELSVN